MAKKNTITQKIKLEGEKEYNAKLQEASRNLKTLDSRLKAETAELGKNATQQQKNELRTKNLQLQIAEQEKVVKTLTEALKQAKEQYSDNEDVIQDWEQRLNKARASLANMKNGLNDAGGGFRNIASNALMAVTASNSVADSFDKLAKAGDSISGALENAFTGAVGAVREAVTAVWGEISALAAKSNNYMDLAGFWNTSATEIQKYGQAVRYAGADLETLNDLVIKITTADSKKIAELTGVSQEGYTDLWEYAMAVMDAMNLIGQENPNKRNDIAEEIFGKKGFTKAMALAQDWEQVKENLWRFDAENGGLGLKQEEIEKMDQLAKNIEGIRANWESLKEMAVISLTGDLAMNLTGNVQAILDALKKYLDADSDEERQAAIKEIDDNIVAMFDAVKKAIEEGLKRMDELAAELQKSDNPAVKAVGDIMAGLVQALEWFTEDNANNAVKALGILVGFWAGPKVLSTVATIGKFAASLRTLKTFKMSKDLINMLGGGGNGGTPTTTGTPTGTPIVTPRVDPTADSRTSAFTSKMIDKFGVPALTTAAKVGGTVANLAGIGIMGGTMLLDQTHAGQALRDGGGVEGAINALKEDIEYTFGDENKQAFAENWDIHGENANVIAKGIGAAVDFVTGAWNDTTNWVSKLGNDVSEGLVQPVAQFVGDNVENALRFWMEKGGEAGEFVGGQLDNAGRFWEGVWNELTAGLDRMFESSESKRARNEAIDQAEMGEERSKGPVIVAEIKTEEVWEDLDEDMNEVSKVGYTLAEQIHAIDEWWDEYMALYNGTGDEDRENELFNAMQEALGDQFGDTWDEIIRTLDEMGDGAYSMYDIPPSWWQNLNQDGITQGDVAGLNNTLGTLGRMVLEGASAGVSKGISGIQVAMDGQRVGELVAPYVSRHIAYTIM